MSQKQPMEGLAMPLSGRGLDSDVRSILAESYPDTDFDACLVVVQYVRHEKEDAPFFAAVFEIGAFVGVLFGLPSFAFGIIAGRTKRSRLD